MLKETIKNIKTDFFALRNGAIADRLRSAGSPYKIIFGLMVPQIEQVAARQEPSVELAETLWANDSTRESRLMATMVCPREAFTREMAEKWVAGVDTEELADMLCFRLLRYMDGAEQWAGELYAGESRMNRYVALRLLMNLAVIGKLNDLDLAGRLAKEEDEADSRAMKLLRRQLADEVDWMKEEA